MPASKRRVLRNVRLHLRLVLVRRTVWHTQLNTKMSKITVELLYLLLEIVHFIISFILQTFKTSADT